MKHKKWMITAKRADFNEIARACGISPVLARLIRNRDVIGVEETRRFLGGKIEDLHDPRLLPDADKAVDILTEKIRNGNKIRIIGDYDVDGICSSFILWHSLRAFGGQADAMLPERMTDGYGINERLVRCAAEDGIDTIMTCDNGIAASGPLQTAKEMGLTVIVTDHHEVPYKAQEDGSVEPCKTLIDKASDGGEGARVIPVRGYHDRMPVLGFRFGDIAYITDMSSIPEEEFEKLRGLRHLTLNTVGYRKHHSHFSLDEVLGLADRIGATHTWLTHLSHTCPRHAEFCEDLRKLCAERGIRSDVQPAWDGLVIE